MKNIEITNYEDLILRIMYLKSQKIDQETELKRKFKDLFHHVNIFSIIKDSLLQLAKDKEIQLGVASMGISMAVNLILDKILNKKKSSKGFFSSLWTEIINGPYLNQNLPLIVSGISNLMNRKSEEEKEEVGE